MLVLLFGCGGTEEAETTGEDEGATEDELTATLSSIQSKIFSESCALSGCHSSGSSSGGLNLSEGNSFGSLVGQSSTSVEGGTRVLAGNSGDSVLVKRIEGTVTPQMPLNRSALSEEKIDTIKNWINNGAENN